jgi:diketogulonate reductase-like aldo/keto reductase
LAARAGSLPGVLKTTRIPSRRSTALEVGVNWIDTAVAYGMGHSEEMVARALATWSGPRPYVFTKCGLRWDERGQVHKVLKADSIRRECEDSLRRLRVEVIDLYQIRWPTGSTTETDRGWATMTRERAASLATDDWRRRDPEFNEPKLSQNLALVKRLRAVGAQHGR